jgi:hypothetical protein
MGVEGSKPALHPDALEESARQLLAAGDAQRAGVTAIEEALRRAYQRVADDLLQLDERHNAGESIDIQAVFGDLLHEKLAAILVLARYTMSDMAACAREVLDIEYAHRDHAVYSEILYRANALEGLGVLYDHAVAGRHGPRADFWQNAALHTLYLMALNPQPLAVMCGFLQARPLAQQHVQHLMTVTQPAVAQQLQQLLAAAQRPLPPADPPAPYMRLYGQYDQGFPYDGQEGLCAGIAAAARIHATFAQDDLAGVLRWYAGGSPTAVRAVLQEGRAALPIRQYARLLEKMLAEAGADPQRLAAVVLDLGALNRAERPHGGDAELNRILFEVTMARQEERVAVACLAVRELGAVENQPAMLVIIEHTPQLRVAEEAIMALKDMRRLLTCEALVARRPTLVPAYKRAHAILTEIQNLVDLVWSTEDADIVDQYVERLKKLKAFPELKTIADLANRSSRLSGKGISSLSAL